MNNQYYSTIQAKKGKHLTDFERGQIKALYDKGYSYRFIAKQIGRVPSTISNEIKRGLKAVYNGNVYRYYPEVGKQKYLDNRKACGRKSELNNKFRFIQFVEQQSLKEKWSLDACVGYALSTKLFTRLEVYCTKSLYNLVDKNLLRFKNIDLPEKLSRKTKRVKHKKNKRILGSSIDERPSIINKRNMFGHWECDLIVGNKNKTDSVLLILLERKTRRIILMKLEDKKSITINKAFDNIMSYYGKDFSKIFKSITTDNGSEFADLALIEEKCKTKIYYTHPFTSCEKGSIERANRIIRKFIRKGTAINNYSSEFIERIEIWCNDYPRAMFNYQTPDTLFDIEMDKLLSA